MRTVRRMALAAAAVAMLAGSCTASRVDPEARIEVRGSLERQSGSPVEGAKIALTRGADLGEALITVFTFGLACLDEQLPNACHGSRVTSTGADGSFGFVLTGADTQGIAGTASTMELAARLPRGANQLEGAAVSLDFLVQTEQLSLPLRFWEPSVAAVGDARSARIRWSKLSREVLPARVSLADLRTAARFARGDELVWEYANLRSGDRIDARLLEDSEGAVAVMMRARDVQVPDESGDRIGVTLRSPLLPYASRGVAPTSRGAPCFAYDRRDRPVGQPSCPLTDGNYRNGFSPATAAVCPPEEAQLPRCQEPHHTRAFVDLGARRTIDLVALRGCDGPCSIETSRDGKRWRFAGRGGDEMDAAVSFRIRPPVRARYVRVSAQGGVAGMTEVSVWDTSTPRSPGERGSLLTALGQPGGSGRGFPQSGDDGPAGGARASRAWPVGIAVVLGLAVALGVGIALGRRSRA